MTPEQQREAVRLLEAIWKDVLLPPGLAAKVGVFRESLKSTPTTTVRVRAAVAVTKNGSLVHWTVCGDDTNTDDESAAQATANNCGYDGVHWLEADIPLPQPQTIQAEVVE